MSVKVMTTPSTPFSWVRYGRIRRMNQAPLRPSISRSIGVRDLEHRSRVGQQIAVGASDLRSASGRPMSLGNDTEQRLRGRREEADVEIGVEKNRRDIGAVQDVLQIVGGRPLPLQRFLELAVEGGQLLVQRLQFLLRGQQFLVRRLILLVDRNASSLIAFCSSLEISRLRMALCSSARVASSSCSSSATRGASRGVAVLPRSRLAAARLSTKQTSSSSSPSLATGWTTMLNETGRFTA